MPPLEYLKQKENKSKREQIQEAINLYNILVKRGSTANQARNEVFKKTGVML